ncbi:MAG: tRNA pseudouridine(13) synthase TruD [Methanomicrobiaceae archaeon]|nr:tRNA pseudouridine(13) synthase TruD [Methanomicrobiaceae archaeon]
MMQSVHPLERMLGMNWYAGDTPGIGGIVKQVPEDFIVEEIPLSLPQEGPFLLCKLWKRNWETQRAVREIAKRLRISHKKISWAGTKDKRAETIQYISIPADIPSEDIEAISLKDISLEIVGRTQKPLSLGSLAENRFHIRIRACDPEDLDKRVREGVLTAAEGVPNYYGIQRFGVIRPITHLVGKHILRGDFEEAVRVYVGLACTDEPEPTRNARAAYYDDQNAADALRSLPVQLQYERALLHHLHDNPEDYRGAILSLPPKLRSLFVSAYQSWLFNQGLSWRCENGTGLAEPAVGDTLLFLNGRDDIITSHTLSTAAIHLRRGRCAIALAMPGSQPRNLQGPVDDYIGTLLEHDGITQEHFGQISDLLGIRFKGALRPIALHTDATANITGDTVELGFSLPPGQYATTVCREFMKAPPQTMI